MRRIKIPHVNRRTALRGLGAAAASRVLSSCTTPGDDDSGAPQRELSDVIDTVVFLMMENRSFDHLFGAMSLEGGRSDIDGLVPGLSNIHPDGGLVEPYPESVKCIADPPHGWNSVHEQWQDGGMGGFVQSYRDSGATGESCRRVMGYFGREMQPASWRLAETHALCQRWFCSVLGPTWPNRLYSHSATSNGARGNDFQDDRSMPTIYHRLLDAGIPWADYSGNAPFLLGFPGLFSADRFYALEDFVQDALVGALPRLTVVEPIYGRNDDHPPTHPLAGQILIQTVYEALAQGPHWNRCALIVTYDEHGGFYDHVPPPTTADSRSAEGFGQMGIRVPAFVVSPYSKRGHVSSTVFDHASYPAFLERLWGLPPLNERDAAANDMFDLFDMERVAAGEPAAPTVLEPITVSEAEIYAPECVGGGLLRDGRGVTLQPEFEDYLDQIVPGHPADRRARTSEIVERFMESARALGVWQPA